MNIPDETLEQIVDLGLKWIKEQRSRFLKVSRGLSYWEKKSMEDFFSTETLLSARIAQVPQIENPPFIDDWKSRGMPMFIDLRQSAGITFIDTIVVATRFHHTEKTWLSLLYHELVHVVQYRILTKEEMIRQYIKGWINNGFDYYRIPLEEQAYRLQRKFDMNSARFSVEQYITTELGIKSN